MVGKRIKEFAEQNHLTVKDGIAFGKFHGYMLTMREGMGWRSVAFSFFSTPEALFSINNFLNDAELKREYGIQRCTVNDHFAEVVFFDNRGTAKKVEAFLDIMVARLASAEIAGTSCCAFCGTEFDAGIPVLGPDNIVYYTDVDCLTEKNIARAKSASTSGNTALGALGALLGGAVGAIPWAIAYYYGWFVGWLGFLIGIAAKKGYEILHGKESRAKGVWVIVATVFGVLLAQFATLVFTAYTSFTGEGFVVTVPLCVMYLFSLFTEVPEFRGEVIKNVLMGLFFAALGILSTAKSIFSANGTRSYKRLDL